MSAILLIVILIGGAVIAFFVRFLIALYQESRSRPTGRVKRVYEGYKLLSPKLDGHTRSYRDGQRLRAERPCKCARLSTQCCRT